jgi:hypothetical protein
MKAGSLVRRMKRQAEAEKAAGIGESSGPASEVRSLTGDPEARAAAEDALNHMERRPRRKQAFRYR